MTTTINNEHKKLNFSSEREQSQACLDSAEHEKNQGRKVLNAPNLRFPEFKGEWEEHYLSDYLDFKNGLNPKPDKFGKGIKFISVMDILNNAIITNDCIRAFVDVSEEELQNFCVENGDILFQRSSETLEDVGRANVYIDDKPAIFGGFVIRGKKKAEYNPLFFRYLLASPFARKKIIPMGAGAQHFNIGQEGLSKVKLNFASLEEQDKIAKLLFAIDERIATQSRVIEDLKKLKCAIIEKLLNCREGKKFCLGDVGAFVRGLTYSSDDVVEENGTLVMRSNNIVNGSPLDYKNNIVYVNKHISSEQLLQSGDIVICMANGSSSLVGKSSYYDGGGLLPITVGAFCGIYRSNEPLAKWLFQTSAYRRYIWKSLQGGNGAIANLNSDDILRMSFKIPTEATKERFVTLLTSTDTALKNNVELYNLYFFTEAILALSNVHINNSKRQQAIPNNTIICIRTGLSASF